MVENLSLPRPLWHYPRTPQPRTQSRDPNTWAPRAREHPRHGKLGKPSGKPGGGKSRPEVIHKRIHVMPDTCAHCGAGLSEVPAHISHTHVFTDLENLQGPDAPFK